MCMYDYTPYSGCRPGEQHSYLQWMKCNKAVSDNSYYCPIEKSIPVEELRKLSGNTLRCPIHCPIAVQQHEFLFVQRRARIETAHPGPTPERRDNNRPQSRPAIRRGKSVSRDEAGSVQAEEPMPDLRVVREARRQNTVRDVSPSTELDSRPASPGITRPKTTTGVKPVEENRQTEERKSRRREPTHRRAGSVESIHTLPRRAVTQTEGGSNKRLASAERLRSGSKEDPRRGHRRIASVDSLRLRSPSSRDDMARGQGERGNRRRMESLERLRDASRDDTARGHGGRTESRERLRSESEDDATRSRRRMGSVERSVAKDDSTSNQTERRSQKRVASVDAAVSKEDTVATQADRRSLRASISAAVPIPVGLGIGLPPSPDIHRRSKTMTRGRSGSLLSDASNAEISKQPTDTVTTSSTARGVRMVEPATTEATSSNTRQEERQMDIIEEHTVSQDTKQSRRGGKLVDPATTTTTTTNHNAEQDQEREQRQRAVPTAARLVRSRTDAHPTRLDDTAGSLKRTNKYFSDMSPTGATTSAPEQGDPFSLARGKPSRPSRSPSRRDLTVGTTRARNTSLSDSKSTSPSTTGGMTPSPGSTTSFLRQSNDSGYLSGHHRSPSQGSAKAKGGDGGLGPVPPTPGFAPPMEAGRFGGGARPASFMVHPGPANAVNVVGVEKRLSGLPPQNQYRGMGVSQSAVNLPSTMSSVTAAGGLVSGFDPGTPTVEQGSLGKLKRKLSGMLPWDRSKVAVPDPGLVGQAR
ncbi:hypothetical protein B0H67DRAFT_547729 [Lasiosphaeris hirsuta]|uniref:Uncharacterized protein n=1 Tax=Lasiosphaeris hirsuta TaxID=260670 RepID=A0AA40B8H3_9PEZI|nr:hypothetical protein B0H67DRAFT_547729 [Lasiosphaeris hirsuta]